MPKSEKLRFYRFYVTDAESGEDLGYIQANLYYDTFFEVDVVKSIDLKGNEPVLQAIVAVAEQRQVEKIGRRDLSNIDNFLVAMSTNGLSTRPYKMSAKRYAEKRAATQAQVWEVQI